ncbi:oxysterol-binding protein-related protein 5 isoform X1 [Hyla sarda]|uniref:oxysterol-binding protein-related protein 5 isoform X1 n=2 Tax=Hyla sarda TaxID=327740 RepID=UPI0024C2D4D4|nr:oxysterol-binding protein-related protein 5 isoform X1 [Hyla sarda]
MPCCTKTSPAHNMKEENFLRRRFSLCPTAITPPKNDNPKLARNLSFGADHDMNALNTGKDTEHNSQTIVKDEAPLTPDAANKNDNKLCNGTDKECLSPTSKSAKMDTLKVQKKNYRQEKKRATKQLFSALKDPTVVIVADWLKIRGTLKSWTKLWCVLKPGLLLIYKTPKVGQWVGTLMLHSCELIERPTKKDGFCFKLYHPLDQSIWAVKGPKGENVGSITLPLPSSYLIFRAASESDGRCWMDALELALRCSSLFKINLPKQGKEGDAITPPDMTHNGLYTLLQASTISEQELFMLHEGGPENDTMSDKSEKDNIEESEHEQSRKTSESDQSELHGEISLAREGTTYMEELYEEFGEIGEASQMETVSDENKSLMWTILKQMRPGMDLSRVVLPTFILEPRSFLNKLSDYYYHADILSEAAVEDDPYCRMKQVLKWYLSGFYKKPKGIKKPYNSILGEKFRCCWFHPQTNSHTFYIAEQVSHHPPVSAFHVSNRKDGFCITGSILARSKFYGNSLSAILDGKARLTFLNRDEEYIITMPYAHCKGLLYGTMTMELGGKVTIECEKTSYTTELEFKLKPFFGGSDTLNQICGKITAGSEVLANLDGHWDREVYLNDLNTNHRDIFWNPTAEIRRQRLKRHIVLFEEQTEKESERLWQYVTSAINEGNQQQATDEKYIIEEAQRKEAKERKEKDEEWSPQLFEYDSVAEWRYKYEDTRPWHPLTDIAQYEKDGILQTVERNLTSMLAPRANPQHKRGTQDRRHRKASEQPSISSQTTESSCSTPESRNESSDDDGFQGPCSQCGKEKHELKEIQAAVLSLQKTQQDINRNLSNLTANRSFSACSQPRASMLNSRHWLLLCLFLTCQLFINFVFK